MEEKPKVINLGEKRKEKENKKKRTTLGVSSDGHFLYPEETVDLTLEEALVLADEIIEKYQDPSVLFQDFVSRRRAADGLRISTELPDDTTLKREMEEDLESQRGFANLASTESLVKLFDRHTKNPTHYYGVMLLASAEALKKKFKSSTD